MKRVIFLGIVLLTAATMVGCSCYPYGYNRSCMTGACTTGGVVDYVDGGPGAGEANCGGYVSGYGGGCGCGSVGCGSSYGGDCLRCIGNTIKVVGEGALAVAAAPFVIAGHIICSGCNGYETYPNCGCSNEVYYGDNCSQQHDFVDPCGKGGDCGCGTSATTFSGCARCSGGYVEGVQPAGNPGNPGNLGNPGNPGNLSRRPTNIRTVSHQGQAVRGTSCPNHSAPRSGNGPVINGAWSNQTPATMVR